MYPRPRDSPESYSIYLFRKVTLFLTDNDFGHLKRGTPSSQQESSYTHTRLWLSGVLFRQYRSHWTSESSDLWNCFCMTSNGQSLTSPTQSAWIILGMDSSNGRRHYNTRMIPDFSFVGFNPCLMLNCLILLRTGTHLHTHTHTPGGL